MNKYEILYIIRCDIDDDQTAKVVEKYEALVGTIGGTVELLDKWGLKKFAYEINKQTEGYYVLMNVVCSQEAEAEIDRQMGIDEHIVRKMIIKK
ncbi:MAG: 30S ribosomal protein S6 [Clostridia bacterium]